MSNLTRAFIAKQISQCGDVVFSIVGIYWIYEITGSIAKSVLGIVISYIATFIVSLFVSSLVDNYRKKTLVVTCEFIQFSMFLILSLMVFYNITDLYLIYMIQFISALVGVILETSFQSWLIHFIKKDVSRTYATLLSISSANKFLFLIMSGFLVQYFGYFEIFMFNALTFLFAGLIEIGLPDQGPQNSIRKVIKISRILEDFNKCITFVCRERPIFLQLSLVFMVFNLFFAPMGLLVPLLLKVQFGEGPVFYGQLMIVMTAGSSLLSLVFRKFSNFTRHSLYMIFVAGIFGSVAAIVTASISNKFYMFPVMFVVSLVLTSNNVIYSVAIRELGTRHFAKISMISSTIGQLLIPLGLFVSSILSEKIGIAQTFLYSGISMGAVLVLLSLAWIRSGSNFSQNFALFNSKL